MILNSTFEKKVIVNTDTEFSGCKFTVKGATKKDQASTAIEVKGDANLTVSECEFATTGYHAIYITTSGKVVIENSTFDCTGNYNPIECTVSNGSDVADVTIRNNAFNGVCGNNYLNFYKMAEDAIVNIEDNKFVGVSRDSEIVRLSNPNNASATFNINRNNYTFAVGEVSDYTAFIMCQDYTAKNGNPQDFSKYVVNIEGLKCNSLEVVDGVVAEGALYFVYQDDKGIITGENDPVINLK